MNTRLAKEVERIRDGISRVAVGLTVSGARRVPSFREHILRRLSETLENSYSETEEDAELLALQLWFGRTLKPFLLRMLDERPRAAKRLVHLAYVWSRDVRRRTKAAEDGVVTPATLVIEPTGRCNLRCPGCYANSTSKGEELN